MTIPVKVVENKVIVRPTVNVDRAELLAAVDTRAIDAIAPDIALFDDADLYGFIRTEYESPGYDSGGAVAPSTYEAGTFTYPMANPDGGNITTEWVVPASFDVASQAGQTSRFTVLYTTSANAFDVITNAPTPPPSYESAVGTKGVFSNAQFVATTPTTASFTFDYTWSGDETVIGHGIFFFGQPDLPSVVTFKADRAYFHEPTPRTISTVIKDQAKADWLSALGQMQTINRIVNQRASAAAGEYPARETHVFAALGQSNQVGLNTFDDGTDFNATHWMLGRGGVSEGLIIPAVRPIHHYSRVENNLPTILQFVLDYQAANPNVDVLIMPGAQGSTGFQDSKWGVGNPLHEDAIARMNAILTANPDFVFKGIVWHQGENDSYTASAAAAHAGLMDAGFADMRARIIGASDVPVVVGQLPQQFAAAHAATVRTGIAATPSRLSRSAFADSDGLAVEDDDIHFTGPACRTLGARMYTAWATIT